jgi:hypothetical protein
MYFAYLNFIRAICPFVQIKRNGILQINSESLLTLLRLDNVSELDDTKQQQQRKNLDDQKHFRIHH